MMQIFDWLYHEGEYAEGATTGGISVQVVVGFVKDVKFSNVHINLVIYILIGELNLFSVKR